MTKSWEEHKETIITQYKENNKPLHEVQRFMEDRHGFKASTRAYRSRFDKWGVHKYSCRKRKGSDGEDNDHLAASDMHSPDPERRDSSHYGHPEEADSSSPSSISPSSSHDRHFYGTGGMGGATPPSDLGSPIPKFETGHSPYSHHHHHHHHHHQAPLTPPSLRHPLAATQGYLADPHQYSYPHHQFGGHHHYGTQPAAAESYYRTSGPQDHIYHHLQAPEIDMGVHHHHYGGGYSDGGGDRS